MPKWERFCAESRTDDWCALVDALGIDFDYTHLGVGEASSYPLRLVVVGWCGVDGDRWQRTLDAMEGIGA